jgi:hypothetical protein
MSRSTFCNGVTFPQGTKMPTDLLKDYDAVKKNFTTINPSNFYIKLVSAAGINVVSDNESTIINKINRLTDDKIKTILGTYGINDYTQIKGTNGITEFNNKLTAITTEVRLTYCIYETLYQSALTILFQDIQAGQVLNQQKKLVAIQLNKKLLILLSGINRMNVYLNKKSTAFMQQTGWTTNSMNQNTIKLQKQLGILESRSAEADLHKRMSEYTDEKNRANRNLLSLYTLLNAVALGMIFYIAKD